MRYRIFGTGCLMEHASTRAEALRMGSAMARGMHLGGAVLVLRDPDGAGEYSEHVARWRVPVRGEGRVRRVL
jgi:hypothetical protein